MRYVDDSRRLLQGPVFAERVSIALWSMVRAENSPHFHVLKGQWVRHFSFERELGAIYDDGHYERSCYYANGTRSFGSISFLISSNVGNRPTSFLEKTSFPSKTTSNTPWSEGNSETFRFLFNG